MEVDIDQTLSHFIKNQRRIYYFLSLVSKIIGVYSTSRRKSQLYSFELHQSSRSNFRIQNMEARLEMNSTRGSLSGRKEWHGTQKTSQFIVCSSR